MVKVEIHNPNKYPLPLAEIEKVFGEITENGVVSLAFVTDKKMDELVQKYYKGDPENLYLHPILTFPTKEITGEFVFPDGQAELGEIIISFEQASARAKDEGVRVEKIILSLAEHGILHLLGIHHD